MNLTKLLLFLLWITYTIEGYAPPQYNYSSNRQERCDVFGKEIVKQQQLDSLKESAFTVSNFLKYLELKEVRDADIIVKQAVIESGWFKSKLTTDYNNLFGMCMPRVRKTVASGIAFTNVVHYKSTNTTIKYSYAAYNHWTDSVDDLLLLHEYYRNRGHCTNDYYAFLNSIGYAYESNYVKVLKSVNLEKALKQCENMC